MQPLLAVAALLATPGGLTDAEFARALKGEVPTHAESFLSPRGRSAGRGVGAIVIDRPLDDVWAVISRYDDKAEYVPRLEKVEILDRQPDRLHIRMRVNASVTTARYTAWFKLDEKEHAIHWKLDGEARDNTIADCDGDYLLFALEPARTLVVYRSFVDTGLRVPRFIQEYMSERSIPNLLRAIKKRVESGGKWKK
jgi:carbon monoxide dehydrogenase subunit G